MPLTATSQRPLGAVTLHAERVRIEATVVAAIGLAILSNGPSVFLSRHYAVPLGWESWPYLVPMGFVAFAGVFLVGHSLDGKQLRLARWPLAFMAAYLGWSIMSVMWSVAPDATAARSLLTMGAALFGIWFGLSMSFKEQLLAVSTAMASLTVWSLGVILLQPHSHQIYPPPWHPGWHTTVFGIFGNPNSLGPVAALTVLSGIGMWLVFPNVAARLWAVLTSVVGIVLVLWSQCETAIAGLFIGAMAIILALTLPLIRRIRWWMVAGSIVGGTLIVWQVAFAHIDRLAPMVGADSMLSSRRIIWRDVREAIALRPWRGYGFFAYWDNAELTAATYQRVGAAYGSAHNSILEVALGLGRVGLVVYVGLAGFMIVGVARSLWRLTSAVTVAWVVLVLFLIVQNSMESFVLWHSYLWALFAAAVVVPCRLISLPASPQSRAIHDDSASNASIDPDEFIRDDTTLVGITGSADAN